MAKFIYFKKTGETTASIKNIFGSLKKDIAEESERNIKYVASDIYEIMMSRVKLPSFTGTFKESIHVKEDEEAPQIIFDADAQEQWSKLNDAQKSRFSNYPNRVKTGSYAAVVVGKYKPISKAMKIYRTLNKPIKMKLLNQDIQLLTNFLNGADIGDIEDFENKFGDKIKTGKSFSYNKIRQLRSKMRKEKRDKYRGSKYSKEFQHTLRMNIHRYTKRGKNVTKK